MQAQHTFPRTWKLFDRRGEQSLLELDEWTKSGGLIAGIYCIYAPVELIRAAGAVPVGLCGKKQDPIAEAEKTLPASLCPLIKSSYGYAITDSCPFFAASDFIVGETTCDGKKKMYEFLGRIKPVHLIHLPYTQKLGLDFWHAQLLGFLDFLQQRTGVHVTEHALHQEIAINKDIRQTLYSIAQLWSANQNPLPGTKLLPVMESKGFVVDQEKYLKDLHALEDELRGLRSQEDDKVYGPRKPRILLTGCPVGKGSDKVVHTIEELGGVVVASENCSSLKPLSLAVVEQETDFLRALAASYLQLPCSCMTPNEQRFSLLSQLVADFDVQGIVDLTWTGCHTYNVESTRVEEYVTETLELPFIQVDTDYSTADTGQLQTRLGAFLELVNEQITV
jgi:benzoyl-CoA reductase/2-hydroxyglutaryl-CoA dehydratase subunit BcrC/BadD/HgdB